MKDFVKKHPRIATILAALGAGATIYGASQGIPPEYSKPFVDGFLCALGAC